jgi:hypothetical protein
VRDQHGDRRARAVVQGQKTGRLELARHGRAAQLARHARMDARQDGEDDGGDERPVQDPEHRPEPPREQVRAVEPGDVDDRERPPVQEVEDGAVDLRPVPIRREHRPEHVRDVHARDPEALAPRHQRRQQRGGGETPDQPARPAHAGGLASAGAAAGRCSLPVHWSSRRRASIASAALISPT